MSATVYRITTMLSSVLRPVPLGTNLGLFHLLWTLLSGRLLASRGAIIPALADPGLAAPAEAGLQQRLVQEAAARLAPAEVLVVDGGFPLSLLLSVGVARFVVRLPKNFTARRATLPPYRGCGRPPEYGEIVRPLARHYKERRLPATPPDREEPFLVDDYLVRVQYWDQLVLAEAKPGAPTFACLVIHDPRYSEPLLLATPLSASGAVIYALYGDRWPIEQWPLVGKHLLGA